MIDPEDLNRQLASASAKAFVLIAGGNVAAIAGTLTSAGFEEMTGAIVRHWSRMDLHDLNRSVGLVLDQQYMLLYAKFLPDENALLGLAFPLQTPLIRVRQDMTHFMRLMLDRIRTSREKDRGLEQSLQSMDIIGPIPDPELHQLPGVWEMEITDLPEELSVDREYLSDNQNSNSLPVPEQKKVGTENPEPVAETIQQKTTFPSDWRPLTEDQPQEEDLVSILQGKYQAQETAPEILEESVPVEPAILLEDTHPFHIDKVDHSVELQTVSDVTFYLVPASPHHFLIGELSIWLRRWMPELCEMYGWQLGYLSVRPDYIKWTLEDFPEMLIRKMLQIVRQHTSERIFRVFPNLKLENPSGDFWAPGYLVDTQHREITTQALMVRLAANRLSK